MKSHVISRTIERINDPLLLFILFSDDISLINNNWDVIMKTIWKLKEELAVFGLKLASEKTNFIRFGKTEKLFKIWGF